jgi:hypothetical protein
VVCIRSRHVYVVFCPLQIKCLGCGKESRQPYCSDCKRSVITCSVCNVAVKGLCTLCPLYVVTRVDESQRSHGCWMIDCVCVFLCLVWLAAVTAGTLCIWQTGSRRQPNAPLDAVVCACELQSRRRRRSRNSQRPKIGSNGRRRQFPPLSSPPLLLKAPRRGIKVQRFMRPMCAPLDNTVRRNQPQAVGLSIVLAPLARLLRSCAAFVDQANATGRELSSK